MKERNDDPIVWSNSIKENAKNNPYGFDFKELSNDQLLQYYIASNQAVFLHGQSGVGKSSRVKQIDPDAVRITLRNQMNPEEIDGTLDRETGKFIPPLWYQQIVEKCNKEPNKMHVLFIDELTNVKPPIQSLVYSIVLDRAGKDGLWPLPKNCAVVAAGNENADNLAAYPLTNALFRRFSHIYFDSDINKWFDWALNINDTVKLPEVSLKEVKEKMHPSILAFLMTNRQAFYQDLDEESPKIVTDPRKWEIASKILYKTNNPYSLKPAIGDELTESFINFVRKVRLSVQDVVNQRYDRNLINEIKNNTAEKYATTAALSNASEKEMPIVRNFIKNYIDKEQVKVFDLLWIKGSKDRAHALSELMSKQNERTM